MVDFVYARSSANVDLPNGATVLVSAGCMVPATDPLVAARPDLFSPDPRFCVALFGTVLPDDLTGPPIEFATAVPGERRNTRRP
jgi:hypothetical protein